MKRVREMAENLFSPTKEDTASQKDISPLLGGEGMPDPKQLEMLFGLFSKFKNNNDDSTSRLLLALKPHLSGNRRERVDTAIKILKLLELLPLIRESGLIDLF
jgi:hypothetical protein